MKFTTFIALVAIGAVGFIVGWKLARFLPG